jgi:hypothetical protein
MSEYQTAPEAQPQGSGLDPQTAAQWHLHLTALYQSVDPADREEVYGTPEKPKRYQTLLEWRSAVSEAEKSRPRRLARQQQLNRYRDVPYTQLTDAERRRLAPAQHDLPRACFARSLGRFLRLNRTL